MPTFGIRFLPWSKDSTWMSHWHTKSSRIPNTNLSRLCSISTQCSRLCSEKWTRLREKRISPKSNFMDLSQLRWVTSFIAVTKIETMSTHRTPFTEVSNFQSQSWNKSTRLALQSNLQALLARLVIEELRSISQSINTELKSLILKTFQFWCKSISLEDSNCSIWIQMSTAPILRRRKYSSKTDWSTRSPTSKSREKESTYYTTKRLIEM